MNFSELQREVKSIIKDASPEILVSIPDYINEAIQQIAEEVRFAELKQVTSFTTSITTYWVSIASSFTGRLCYAGDSDGEYTVLDGGIEELIRLYPSLAETGDLQHLTLEGGIVYYQPIPAVAKVVTCIGYKLPDTLTNDTDTPSFIPEYYHRESIVYKAVEIAYDVIEDALEDKLKPNTKHYRGLAEKGINRLHAWASRRRSTVSTSYWSD
jgi:hypothetical protein